MIYTIFTLLIITLAVIFIKIKQQKQKKTVLFCLLDASASMLLPHKAEEYKHHFDEFQQKLINLYGAKNVTLKYIRYNNTAKYCSEGEFYHSKDIGGTIMSSGLKLCNDIQKQEYSSKDVDFYVVNITDNYNWPEDDLLCKAEYESMLKNKVTCMHVFYKDNVYNRRFVDLVCSPLEELYGNFSNKIISFESK
jgi:uncharacterized sporulation protein YeaH/YhbH (DUF444 family)